MKSLKAWDVSGTGQSNTQDLENARSSIPMLNRLEMLVSILAHEFRLAVFHLENGGWTESLTFCGSWLQSV